MVTSDEEEPGLDKYVDTVMIDMTMSVVKAKKAGDLVAIVACPEEGHTVYLKVGKGFF